MRRRVPAASAMPDWLAVFRPERWADDLGDDLAVRYGRIRWAAARRAWLAGEDPRPYLGPPAWELEVPDPYTARVAVRPRSPGGRGEGHSPEVGPG